MWGGAVSDRETKFSTNTPATCLSFTISGPWAHFRRVEGNIVKQTYRLIPRTTLAGLVAAMLGIGRDEYYELFGPDSSAVAIEPTTELRTINMPQNTLSTADEHINRVPPRSRTLRIGLPDSTELRQQHNYEVLVNPEYRVDLWIEDTDRYEQLKRTLDNGESYYVPSLGLSEHLATVEYHGEFDVETGPTDDIVTVDSAVPEAIDAIVVNPGTKYGIERSPAFMKATDGGRTTTGFRAYAYNPRGDPLSVRDIPCCNVDDRTVVFA